MMSVSLVSISHCFLSEEGLRINNPLLTNFWPRRTIVLSRYKCHQGKPEMSSVSSTVEIKLDTFVIKSLKKSVLLNDENMNYLD